jgi:hypothetical protein
MVATSRRVKGKIEQALKRIKGLKSLEGCWLDVGAWGGAEAYSSPGQDTCTNESHSHRSFYNTPTYKQIISASVTAAI